MGVNWQSGELYKALKNQEQQTGLSLAEQNAINNPYGSHSILGLVAANLGPSIFGQGLEFFSSKLNGSEDTGSATDTKTQTNLYSTLGKTLRNFDKAVSSNNTADINKYLDELKKLKDDNPNNKRFAQAYENARKKKPI